MREEIKKLAPEDADRVLELPNSYRDAGGEEGIVIGIEKVVFNMLERGMSEEEIVEIVDLSVNDIKEIRKKL